MHEARQKRRYNSPSRDAALAATHTRIIDAATALFAERGYRGTTLAAIAESAGVSVPRVNLSGAKPELLVEAYERLATGSTELRPVTEEPEALRIMALPTPEALVAYADWLYDVHERSAALLFALRDAAITDPAAAEALRGVRDRDQQASRDAVAWVRGRGVLLGDTDDVERADVWDVISNAETFHILVVERGWAKPTYTAWVIRALHSLVFAPAPA